MPILSEAAFAKLIELITRAKIASSAASVIYSNEIINTIDDKDFSDGKRLKEVLESATCQVASDLSDYQHEIYVLKERVEIRQKYQQLTGAEFEKIVNCEWSIALVREIHTTLQTRESTTLEEVSNLIKRIKSEWSKLRW